LLHPASVQCKPAPNQSGLCDEKGDPEGKDGRMNMQKRRELGAPGDTA
jgi:hypothetical protein